ncbi:MBL fold metallo-hydrolase [Neptunomonas japonica]|uniref:Beta-lactamase domain-containing protein n=1 Tax=Neptunomonas japonica JAMM 1380 TaxID=1441457 RepID=A0A7R6SVX5_9GAMM|nr:MBL fold metallo-hydrolase [Neptunomonas japonica]BBB29890.1 beta-lactamase domain-containing protein [Neptunomonas japonica JAMM 1380]
MRKSQYFMLKGAYILVASILSLYVSMARASSLDVELIAPNIYSIIGPLEQRSEQNLANNATFGFIVSDEGVILIDSGGTLEGAKALERVIHTITPKPITHIINTGGQDHRWFGNRYFTDKGAVTITSTMTQADQQQRGSLQANNTARLTGQNWLGTEPQAAQKALSDSTTLEISGITLQIIPVGPAHTGGETLVWLPKQKVLFSGDVVYVERMLGIGSQSHHYEWIKAFEKIAALQPEVIVPGHGHPTTLAIATQDTYNYLTFLRSEVGKLLQEDEDISSASAIDQSQFSYLKVYEEIKNRNAQHVFEEMEWE